MAIKSRRVFGVLEVVRRIIIATLAKNPKAIDERSVTKSVFILPPRSESERKATNPTRPPIRALIRRESQ